MDCESEQQHIVLARRAYLILKKMPYFNYHLPEATANCGPLDHACVQINILSYFSYIKSRIPLTKKHEKKAGYHM
jgi:hypothetical protein